MTEGIENRQRVSERAAPVSPGDILAGKYRVERVLGVGGMGVVVAATHIDLLERRAIKFMLPAHLSDGDSVARFLREARACSRLKGEHIAKVHDVGRLENGAPYMVMEYLTGGDLGRQLKRRGALPVADAALYVLQACEALAEAHGAGIVHRDVKPENLFLTRGPDGTPSIKVLDFGISKVTGPTADLAVTSTQAIMGSPVYMSPEQLRSTRDVDARADIWSLGVILYELVTNELPFRGENLTALITSVVIGKYTPPSLVKRDLPPALDALVARCLERELDRRYASVAELAADLIPFAPPSAAQSLERIGRLLQPDGVPSSGSNGPVSELPMSSDPLPPPPEGAAPSHFAPLSPLPAQPPYPLSTDTGKPATQRSPTAVTGGTSRNWADPHTPSPTGSVVPPAPRSAAFFIGIGLGIAFALALGGAGAVLLLGRGHTQVTAVAPTAIPTATVPVAPTAIPAVVVSVAPATAPAAPAPTPSVTVTPAATVTSRPPATERFPTRPAPTSAPSPPPQPTQPPGPAGDPFGAGRQ
jgi:serine/threonine protein kinase